MKINKVPNNLLSLDNFFYEKISPSVFTSIQKGCAFQNILYRIDKKNHSNSGELNSLLLPVSNNAVIGIIIHKMFELRTNGEINSDEDFIKCWDQEIYKAEEKLIVKNDHLKHGFLINHLKKLQAMKSVLLLPVHSKKEEGNIFIGCLNQGRTSELGIWDVEYLHGTIDKVVYSENRIEIIDYKTGRIFENDECVALKEDYVVQLKLYAILFEKKFNI